jgi:hypothetical protein
MQGLTAAQRPAWTRTRLSIRCFQIPRMALVVSVMLAYTHRLLSGGIGHNLPQEAPQAFARAVIDVDSY